MPFIAPNYRGKTSQPEKPPWVRDSSSQQSADVPWRRTSNPASKSSTPDRSSSSQESTPPPSAVAKPGTSKLQINLKSTKKPDTPAGGGGGGQKEVNIPIKKEISIPIRREDSPAESRLPASKPEANDKVKPVEQPKRYEPPKGPANPAKKHYKVLGGDSPFLKPVDTDPAPVLTELPQQPPAPTRPQQNQPAAKPPSTKESGGGGRSIPIEIKTVTVEPTLNNNNNTAVKKPEPPAPKAGAKEPKFGKKSSSSSLSDSSSKSQTPEPKPVGPKPNELKQQAAGREPKPANEPNKLREVKSPVNESKPVTAREPTSKPPAVPNEPKSKPPNVSHEIKINHVVNEPKAPPPAVTHPAAETPSTERKNPFEGFPRKSVKQREPPREKSFSPKPEEEIVNFKQKLRPVANVEKEKSLVKQNSEEKPEPVIKVNLKPVESRKTREPPPESKFANNMSSKDGPPPPPPPPPPGMPPPPPPPPGLPPKAPPHPAKLEKLEKLRKMPRRRPDWTDMMKEIEQASPRKLKHVECNDRSKPIIPRMKSRGKFVFDSEAKPATKTDAIHNRLLTEIQSGVKLKKVQTNDRSKPILTGLRKFLRQKTIEEGKEKGGGAAAAAADDEKGSTTAVDEIPSAIDIGLDIDDIDTLREELQSAKQMLELEIQAKLLLAKENRDLKCQNITMEARIDDLQYQLEQQLALIPYDEGRRDSRALKDIKKSKSGLYKCPSGIRKSKSGFAKRGNKDDNKKGEDEEDLGELNEIEEEIATLKSQALAAKNSAEEWEAKCKELSEKLLLAQGKNEDAEQRILVLEKKIEKFQTQKGSPAISSNDKWTQTEEQIQQQGRRVSRQASTARSDGLSSVAEGGGGEDDYDSDDSDLEVDEATVIRKKQEREIKLWENKLRNVKEKQQASQLERKSLKAQQKKLEQELKEQKRRLKELQKEVDKMAKMLRADKKEGDDDDDDDEDESEEGEEEEDEEDEEDESEEDSEEETTSESEEEESSSEEDDPSAPHEDRLALFNKRVKRWDNILNALKKGNYLLRANIDRLKDDLEEVRIKYHDLEHELNTVLADV